LAIVIRPLRGLRSLKQRRFLFAFDQLESAHFATSRPD
jgi:hypothetical protein